jgi:hypothetical protein
MLIRDRLVPPPVLHYRVLACQTMGELGTGTCVSADTAAIWHYRRPDARESGACVRHPLRGTPQ